MIFAQSSTNNFLNYKLKYQFDTEKLSQLICGDSDRRILYIENILNIRLIPRGIELLIQGESKEKINFARSFFTITQDYYSNKKKDEIDSISAWKELYKDIKNNLILMQEHSKTELSKNNHLAKNKIGEPFFVTPKGRKLQSRNLRQNDFVRSILSRPITLATGPAGTGKTFLSIATACSLITSGKRSKLIIARPAVEAGETLGFLPGDLEQKIDPYLRPLYDALYECLSKKQVGEMIETRQIEIAPLAYMRGRTLNDAIIILDESQNCTISQLKMFLTRLGRNSSMCLSGDITQIDLAPGKSGLELLLSILDDMKEVGIIRFQSEDIVRNPLVEKVIYAFENIKK